MLKFEPLVDFKQFPGISKFAIFCMVIMILTTGAMFVSWISDINSEKGISAQSLFILPGLLSNLPAMLISGQSGTLRLNQQLFSRVVCYHLRLHCDNNLFIQLRISDKYPENGNR